MSHSTNQIVTRSTSVRFDKEYHSSDIKPVHTNIYFKQCEA